MIEKIIKFFKKKEKEFVEFEPEKEAEEKITVRMEKLGGIVDVDRIAKLVMDGNIVFLNVKDMQKGNLMQFQASVQKLKRYCNQYGWDIVGTEDGYLLLTPKFVKILRK